MIAFVVSNEWLAVLIVVLILLLVGIGIPLGVAVYFLFKSAKMVAQLHEDFWDRFEPSLDRIVPPPSSLDEYPPSYEHRVGRRGSDLDI